MSRFKTSIVSTVAEGDKTTFVWRVGQVRNVSFGECVKSPVVRVGEKSFWQARYFPKGFTDPDYASIYVTSIDCELKGPDGEDPTKITESAFATVTVKATPKPRNPEAEPKVKAKEKSEQADDDDDDDGDKSIESLSTKKSEKPESKKDSKKGSKAGSKKSAGSKRDGSKRDAGVAEAPADAGGGGPPPVVPVEKELSQMYTNLESSWGFEKMLDIGLLYKWSEGWMNDYGEGKEGDNNKANTQDGFINFEVVVLAVAKIKMDPPYPDNDVTEKGALRTFWVVHDLKRLCQNIGPGKKLSSQVFDNDGDWYLQLYPSGYHGNTKENKIDDTPDKKYMSLYLHSSPKQVELGHVMKQRFRLGLKKYNPGETDQFNPKGYDGVWFPNKDFVSKLHPSSNIEAPIHKGCPALPWGSACMALFVWKARVFGKRYFVPLSIFEVGRDEHKLYPPMPPADDGSQVWEPDDETQAKEFVAGDWNKGGSVCFVLEMMNTDDVAFQSGHMLHYVPNFGAPTDNRCNDSNADISSGKVVCYECGKGYTKDATTYQARMEEYGYEIGREYILDILMREEEHWVDGFLKAVNFSDKINQGVKYLTKQVSSWRIALKKPEEGHVEAIGGGEGEEEEEEEDEDEPKKNPSQQEQKKILKEKLLQDQFETNMAALRKDVEDAHFSKPVCAKCFASRAKLTHPSTQMFFANEPALWAKMRAFKTADEANKGSEIVKVSKKIISDPMFINTPKQVPSKWECPDQNEITSFGAQSSDKINPKNACVDLLDYKLALWDFGTVENSKAMKKVGAVLAPKVQVTMEPPPNPPLLGPDAVEMLTWCGNFRYNWKNKLKLMEDKYHELDNPKDGLFKKVSWNTKDLKDLEKAKHKIPLPEPPESVTKDNEGTKDDNKAKMYMNRWKALNGDPDTNARVAMTLVRGNMWLEPLELTRQCCGRVNGMGINPLENDDATREAFCDVRFDTGTSAVQTHCLWSGKIYCPSCANFKGLLPEFVLPPDSEEELMFTISYESQFYRSFTPSGRIQPVSKKPPEPERVKITPLPEEEEDPPDIFEMAGEWLKANVPVCGKTMAKSVEDIKGFVDPDG
eukprot:CAMPEP_0173083324 /NCGR_PEP_ID=MMETSP1102-20130122/19305_1 /TAXON_ID=49646 /ORGANISM="Geminigera sp., Strain Caron Lab Isolate" /LENGTH=1085 /DNA_ID=CAMNT_0013960083 /DNA_START=111 /DNA_END=3368 /DNA_ORIENTATION=-